MPVSTYVCIQARPTSTNPRYIKEKCEYSLTSGTFFTSRRLEVVAAAGLLRIYLMVCFFGVWWDFVSFFLLSLLRTHTAYCNYDATSCLIYSLLVETKNSVIIKCLLASRQKAASVSFTSFLVEWYTGKRQDYVICAFRTFFKNKRRREGTRKKEETSYARLSFPRSE